MWALLKEKLAVDSKLLAVYVIVYFTWGMAMNWVGIELEIAKFTHWWQVISCYILYMVPISLLLRGMPWHAQYAYGLIAMGLLELGGYAFQTSYAYPGNIVDQLLQERNFSLAMTLFFGFYFPLGNWGVGKIYHSIFLKGS